MSYHNAITVLIIIITIIIIIILLILISYNKQGLQWYVALNKT